MFAHLPRCFTALSLAPSHSCQGDFFRRSFTSSLSLLFSICALVLSLGGCAAPPPDPIHEPVSFEAVKRGHSLVHGLAACGSCHGMAGQPEDLLVGGRPSFDVFGEVRSSNLTPVGLGQYSTQEIVRIMRGAIRPDESELSFEAHRGYEWMSDDDLVAIVSYLRSLEPSGETVPRREIGSIERNTTGFFEIRREVRGYVPAVSGKFSLQRGKYLTDHVARCGYCHTTPAGYFTDSNYLAGGRTVRTAAGEKIAPALLNSQVFGIGDWSTAQIVQFLETGITPDQRGVDPEYCPIQFFARADRSDREEIARYLKSLGN